MSKSLKVVIAGSRSITNYNILLNAISNAIEHNFFPMVDTIEIISGGAKGVDYLAEIYARNLGYKFTKFKANWNKYQKRAGLERNIEMADAGDVLIAIWDGKSTGTQHMIEQMKIRNKPIFLYQI